MAKKSMVAKDLKRQKMIQKYAAKRAELKKTILATDISFDELMLANAKLSKLPRDSSKCRLRNRCAITGRPKGVYSKFGLGRNKLREHTMQGDVPGLRKASW